MKLPSFGKTPFLMIDTPRELQKLIEREYRVMDFWNTSQHGITTKDGQPALLQEATISRKLHDTSFEMIEPYIEEWAGVKTERSWGYGIRSYGDGSILKMHRDRIETHVLSCIVHVDDLTYEPWPLEFVDHQGNLSRVYFERGKTLLYESLCPHGRTQPMNGKFYRNMYFHWKPEGWDSKPYQDVKVWFNSTADAQLNG